MTPARYHHGDLRNALVVAATSLARDGGPAAVVVREAARSVGVSHNAAYRHFDSRESLLLAVADQGLALLAGSIQAELDATAPSGDPVEDAWARLTAAGRGYLRFALAEPGLFRTAFSVVGDPRRQEHRTEVLGGADPYELLAGCIEELAARGQVRPERRANSELVAWSGVHGLANLVLDGPLRGTPPAVVDEIYARVCQVIRGGL